MRKYDIKCPELSGSDMFFFEESLPSDSLVSPEADIHRQLQSSYNEDRTVTSSDNPQ